MQNEIIILTGTAATLGFVHTIFGPDHYLPFITMLGIVLVSFYGLSKLPLRRFERFSHLFAGLAIFLCGIAIKFLGL